MCKSDKLRGSNTVGFIPHRCKQCCDAVCLGDLLLRGLYAFYTEHERCGEWEGGVEGEWVFNLLALHLD